MPRPSTREEVELVCQIAGVKKDSVKNFFSRPGRLSPEMRQRIADAVAEVGYRPARLHRGTLAGLKIGYQLPRTWENPSEVMYRQLGEIATVTQSWGAQLSTFVVDPTVDGVAEVVGGTPDERSDAALGIQGWYRSYSQSLAPAIYRQLLTTQGIQAFLVNDLLVDDRRLDMLRQERTPYVALGKPHETNPDSDRPHPYVETDNYRGIKAMIELLRTAGARDFGHVGFADDDSTVPAQRRTSVTSAVGHNVPHTVVPYANSRDGSGGYVQSLTKWLFMHDHLDAVICDSDDIAHLVHQAARSAGRSVEQNTDRLREDAPDRPLLITGNDDSAIRRFVKPSERWMTMVGDSRSRFVATMEQLQRVWNGNFSPDPVLVAPNIIGRPSGTWNSVLTPADFP